MHQVLLVLLFIFLVVGVGRGASPYVIEADFGRAELVTEAPALDKLVLRNQSGQLEPQSLLSPQDYPWLRGFMTWGTQAYTYVVDAAGTRYESRFSPAQAVEIAPGTVRLEGVKLQATADSPAVAEETWVLSTKANKLFWQVERRWLVDFEARFEGSPALFFSNRPYDPATSLVLPNCVTTTLWYDPDRMAASFDPYYRSPMLGAQYKLSLNNTQLLLDRNPWAIAKLWTNWHNEMEPRLQVDGGYLYRRGCFAWLSEIGAVSNCANGSSHKQGDIERTELALSPLPKTESGYQLEAEVPDKALQQVVQSIYTSLLNGGVVNDQAGYDFGNESDGWYYNGSTWMQGFALQAGAPAEGQVSSASFDVASGFRKHLSRIFGTVQADGRSNFGYDSSGDFVDGLVNTIIGTRAYFVHTGDLAFVRQYLPTMEHMIKYFVDRRNADGLFDLGPSGHWYYDAMPTSGVNANHNALFYKALLDLAEMERAAGRGPEAARYERAAAQIKASFAKVFWNPKAPNGPRLSDWVAFSGEKITYAADVCQFPPVALGLLSEEQASQLLATLDARIAELERDYGYTGAGSLSAYWPVPDHINILGWQRAFPIYMNCGSFLAQTYWEVMARAQAGDRAGALERLEKWGQAGLEHSFMGNNWLQVDGKIGFGASDEPYLSDLIAVPAALVQGLLGVNLSWDKLEVNPRLPEGWREASVDVLWKGQIQHIVIKGDQVTITPGEQVFTPTKTMEWELASAYAPEWGGLTVTRHWATGDRWKTSEEVSVNGGQFISLEREKPEGPLVGLWQFEAEGADSSGWGAKARPQGAIQFGAPGHIEGSQAIVVDGASWVAAGYGSQLDFSPEESFTLEAWFKTDSPENQVLMARSGAYCLGTKEGKLTGWVMQDGVIFREAQGKALVNDGAWHHAALVVDREAQQLNLYLDGQLDNAQAVDISPIGLSTSKEPLSIGSFGGSFNFKGAIDEARVTRGALAPAELGFSQAWEAITPVVRPYPASGWYESEVFDWGQLVRLQQVELDFVTNGGVLGLVVETSDDGFTSVKETFQKPLKAGQQSFKLDKMQPARQVRLRFEFEASPDGQASPQCFRALLRGEVAG